MILLYCLSTFRQIADQLFVELEVLENKSS